MCAHRIYRGLELRAGCGNITRTSTKTLKLGYILSTNSQLGAGATVFADEVAKRTGGRYRIEQYPNSALGGEVEMLKAVQLGTVDLALITGAPLPNFWPRSASSIFRFCFVI